jgi:deoxyribodipyrimidine photo-lyase
MQTAVVLFTRDLRVHDHPALVAACEEAECVMPLFVFDDAALARPIACPNKVAFLLDAVRDLASTVRELGGALVTRRGSWAGEVAEVVAETGAGAVFCSDDSSAFAQRRLQALREALRLGASVEVHALPGITVVPPAALATTSGGHYKVFTPYWRRWEAAGHRRPLPPPEALPVPPAQRARTGSVPALGDLVPRATSPELPRGGETAGRALLDAWTGSRGGVGGYADGHDDLAGDATSRLSPYLHLGCVSPAEIAARLWRDHADDDPGARAFLRQLCWRDFYHQLLAATPQASWRDWRTQGDDWDTDEDHLRAWKAGRTGYPIVDAGMRQLACEGWMHNRARLIVASFLTHDLYLDWRAGAAHFLDLLVDGDIANNQLNWQWVAGTGPTSRRNRVLNPLRQADRYDPEGDYVRRWVPELRSIPGPAVHRPWTLPPKTRATLDYPDPIVDHDDATAAFLQARGKR